MEFDDVFGHIKDFGLYQLIIFLMLGLTSYYPGWQNMGMAILASDMDHWCEIPRLQNFSFDQQKYIAIPYDPEDPEMYSRCDAFNLPYNNYTDPELWEWDRADDAPEGTPLMGCESWVYDRSEFIETAVSKYNLVCDDSYKISLSSTIYLTGMLVGAPLSGVLSDKFGRKTILIVGTVGHLVTAIGAAYAPDYWSFTIIRFLISTTAHITFLCAFVIVMELTAPTYRTILGTFFHGFFSIGYMTLPVFAYYCRDIKYVQLCMAAPVIVSLYFVFIIPESPRWLISKGRYDEALDVLKDLAEVNNETLPEGIDFRPTVETTVKDGNVFTEESDQHQAKNSKQGGFLDLFKYPILRKEILIIYLGWFTNSLLYYGLGLNAGTLPGSIFLNVFIGGAIEIPAVFVTLWGMYYAGRRLSLAWGFVVAAIANFACIPLLDSEDLEWLLIFFSMFGKACIKLTFIVIYAYTAELFPTPVRHIAVGSSSMMSRFGGLLAPFMGAPLMDVWAPLPSIIFGAMALLSGILSFLLPETLNKDMPDTIEEAEELGRKTKKKDKTTDEEIPDHSDQKHASNGTVVNASNGTVVNASNGTVVNGIPNSAIHNSHLSTYL